MPTPDGNGVRAATSASAWFEGFLTRSVPTPDANTFVRFGGNPNKPALVLLHGFPQTHAMWHRVARALHDDFFW